jgi:hypothetical protein
VRIPGFVDAHCHAFQRALRGRDRGGDFWAWRDGMLALAESLTVAGIRREYVAVYRELQANGFTAVGEFHYLGLDEARAAAEAAAEAGIAFVLLHACYLRGGIPRFRQESVAAYLREVETLRGEGIRVGLAPHSVRACPPEALREVGAYAREHGLPLHVHADEQPREIEECLAETGLRPIAMCIGSDSNVRIDPLEELRELEGIARRQSGTRGVVSLDSLLCFGSDEGAAALGLEEWPDAEVDLAHPQLRGVDEAAVYDALVFSCSGDVLRKTSAQ